jgi:hypothetical protein
VIFTYIILNSLLKLVAYIFFETNFTCTFPYICLACLYTIQTCTGIQTHSKRSEECLCLYNMILICHVIVWVFWSFFFKTWFHYIAQAGVKLMILLPQLPKFWNHIYEPPYSASCHSWWCVHTSLKLWACYKMLPFRQIIGLVIGFERYL